MSRHTLLKKQGKRHILGLMSGTSCDGLDMALVHISDGFETGICSSMEYPENVRTFLLDFIEQKKHSLQEISQVNFYLAHLWAGQINAFLDQNHLDKNTINAVASHGQTLWHQPQAMPFMGQPLSSTLQLGDPSVLANLLNIPVVGDFRVADMAVGGQGAPLIPFFDAQVFGGQNHALLSLNIGGISNMTFIPKEDNPSDIRAFDCGPGNMLIDGLCRAFYNEKFDLDGRHAARGKVIPELHHFLKSRDEFSSANPPKSSGREYYGKDFQQALIRFCARNSISPDDALATVTDYTAFAVYSNYRDFIPAPVGELVLSGGGAHNPFLRKRFAHYFKGVKICGSSVYNINENYKEAIGFALMANATLDGKPANIPEATGARRPAVLGKICLV